MNCAFHIQNQALVNCNGCGRPLCGGCDHRIKGFPYCEDCIVEGVDMLRSADRGRLDRKSRRRTYPLVALLLSWICPGLGAAYNGQTVKALVHFGIIAGLFQLAISTGMAMFIIALIGMWWLFLPLDAWRSAKFIRSGGSLDEFSNPLLERVYGSAKISGVMLVAVGAAFLINSFFGAKLLVRGLLPALLVLAGLYLIKDYFSLRNGHARKFGDSDSYPSPTSFADANERFKDGPPKSSWRN